MNYSHVAWALDEAPEENKTRKTKAVSKLVSCSVEAILKMGLLRAGSQSDSCRGITAASLPGPDFAISSGSCCSPVLQPTMLSAVLADLWRLHVSEITKEFGGKIAFCTPLAAFRITNTEIGNAAGNRELPPKASLGAATEDFSLWEAPARNKQ